MSEGGAVAAPAASGAAESAPGGGQSATESDPPAAKPAARPPPAPAAPDLFEYEYEEPDEKGEMRRTKVSETRQQVIDRAARARAVEAQATRQMQETAKFRESRIAPIEKLTAQLKDNPQALFDLAKQLGIDPLAAVNKFVEAKLEEQKLSPEQREINNLRRELQQRETAQKEFQAKTEREQHETVQKQMQARTEQQMVAAAEKFQLPRHPMALHLMSAFAKAQLANGFAHPNMEIAAENVDHMLREYSTQRIETMPYDQLVKTYPSLVKTIREGDVRAATAPRGTSPAAPKPPSPESANDNMLDARARFLGRG